MNKIKYFALVIILILLVLIIRSTYSKYLSNVEATMNKTLAKWTIKVNDTDVSVLPEQSDSEESDPSSENPEEGEGEATESTESKPEGVPFEITGADLVWENENDDIEEGKMAPGTKGYFFIRIDPCDTQTTFKYTLKLDMLEIVNAKIKFTIKSIKIVDGDNNEDEDKRQNLNYYRDGEKSEIHIVERLKSLDEIKSEDENQRIDKIKVEFEWASDDDMSGMVSGGQIQDTTWKIPITVRAIQYTGEEEPEETDPTPENTTTE